MTVTERFRYGPEFTRQETPDGDWIVEGYASTDAVDSYNEVVDPEAFRKYLPRFQEFPIALLNHRWFEKPIGKIVETEVRSKGLWVKALISRAAADVWQLINDGVLKAFSIGFNGRTFEPPDPNVAGSPGIWREIELIEISVVNIPANREALFSVAASKGFSLSQYTKQSTQPVITKGGAEMENTLTLEQVKVAAGEEVKALGPALTEVARGAAKDVARQEVARIEIKQSDMATMLNQIKEASANAVTRSEMEAAFAKSKDDISAIIAQNERLSKRGLESTGGLTVRDFRTMPQSSLERAYCAELNIKSAHARALFTIPEDVFGKDDPRCGLMRDFQVASDTLYLLHVMAQSMNPGSYNGPRSLKYFQTFSKLESEFRRAMDTATSAEGTEWLPVGMSADMLRVYDLALNVAPMFRRFSMPTKVFDWPIQTGHATAYLPGEAITAGYTAIGESTPATAKATFTAKKLAARVLTSSEFIEDAIVEVIPFIRDEIALTLARATDNVTINGDTAAMDGQTGTDQELAWIGLRASAFDKTAVTSGGGAALTVAMLAAARKSMGKYGTNPRECCYFVNASGWFSLLGDSNVVTMDKFGNMATYLTGELAALYGIPLRFTEFLRVNYNAAGYGVAGATGAAIVVHTPSYMYGDRRLPTLESFKIINIDQWELVGTVRLDFQCLRTPVTDDCVWCVYNLLA